ncbi:MAG: ribosomal protein S18-alanine N-acetyltransferase [Gammaproteobacteria bacterium]|nr:ribosomal protein S18-alanine N-acetyltransferase [Gammaproteobacteria bacterium]
MGVMLDLPFKLAVPEDADFIARMSRRLIEKDLPQSWTTKRVANHIRSANSTVVTARDGDIIAGFAVMHFADDSAHLNLLAVEPVYRRCGIGRALVKWLEESARVAGVQFVSLEVRSSNHRALRFYAELGYRETGVIPRYYSGVDDATLLARDLRVTDMQNAG